MPEHHEIDLITATVLGAVQGVTEFLPISSDGHIALFAMLFGQTQMPLSMVVLLHVGTLIATFLVFRNDITQLTRSTLDGLRAPRSFLDTPEGRSVAAIFVASIPTAVIGLALRDAVEEWSHVPWIVGLCLLATAIVVASTQHTAHRATRPGTDIPFSHALLIGVAQGLAVLPGLSRSGSTIACAMLLGTMGPAAFRFSFLMSLPAVLGAVVLELRHPEDVLNELGPTALAGAFVSFLVGLASLLLLRNLIDRGRFWAFSLYLVPLGLGLIAWDVTR
jgi:undecaprenyl-diphosphatase